MDESTPDKIRRNLVIASTLILLAAWLNVPMEKIVERMIAAPTGASSLTPFPVVRIWIACLVVLTYLMLRYRFSSEWYGYRKLISGPVYGYQSECIQKQIQRDFRKYQANGKDSTTLQNQLIAVADKYHKIVRLQFGGADITRPLPVLVKFTPDNDSIWHGLVHAEFRWTEPQHVHPGASMRYAVTGWIKWWIRMRSYGAVVLYSESSIQALVPIVLAATAFVVALDHVVCG